MLSPRGRVQNYKFLMKGTRRKPKGGARFFLWLRHSCRFHSYEATKIELLAGTLGKPEDDAPQYKQLYYCCKFIIRRWRTPTVQTIILKDILVMAKKLGKVSIRGRR